ncbi:MAG: class I SAM-dependent methyltransferase [Myxococcota bacterium]
MHPIDARNLAFYEQVADRFSRTRSRPWRGWMEIDLPNLPVARVLDVGCGNGRLYEHLLGQSRGALDYLGVDFSPALLDHARQRAARLRRDEDRVEWRQLDVHSLDPTETSLFDRIYLFGVMHHVAERGRREALLRTLGRCLQPTGQLWVTHWRFDADDGYRPPSAAPPPPSPNEREGHWLSFDGVGQRFCVAIEEAEIDSYPEACDLVERRRFFADGRTGRMNLYVIYEKPPQPSLDGHGDGA